MLPLNVRVGNLFATVFTVDKVIYHPRLQRARTEQGHQRDHIFEAVRLQTFDQILHAAGFKLEYRRGFRALQHIEAFLVIQRDSGNIQRRLAVAFTAGVDHLQCPVDDGEGTQTEEVKLHQPGIFHVVFIKLGDRVQPLLIAVERCKIGNFSRRDNHATGVLTGVTSYPFKLTRHVDQRANFFICFVNFRQLRFGFKGFGQRHARIGRNQLGDTVHEAIRMPQYAAYVANNRFRRHGTEGDYLRNRVTTVHVRDVFDHLVAFFHTEVNVEIGHRNTFRVKETFEKQVKFERVKVGNFQRIGHQRARTGPTARTYRHAVIFRPLDKFHYDQEVTREAHLVDNLKFNFQTFIVRWALLRTDFRIGEQELQTLLQPFMGFCHEEILGGHIAGRELWQEVLTEAHRHVTALGYLDAVFQRFRNVREQLAHLLFATHILLRRVITRAFWVVEGEAVVDRDANFMGVKITRLQEANVIGCHYRQAARFRQRYRSMQIRFFILSTGTDKLKEIGVREVLFIKRDTLFNQRRVAAQQGTANIPHPRAGE